MRIFPTIPALSTFTLTDSVTQPIIHAMLYVNNYLFTLSLLRPPIIMLMKCQQADLVSHLPTLSADW